ncbi:hypothetical protein OC25_17225 [Pedobacter kyungheensis]|uniref:Uncharacterized protein n=1 Tax=Pedobacter kyungheensis TaxID=1069985 RepID=A0A0C1DEN1_9SPHI|nr:hypothetical protein OC25_17225 [Pedobacter kyungheensis]
MHAEKTKIKSAIISLNLREKLISLPLITQMHAEKTKIKSAIISLNLREKLIMPPAEKKLNYFQKI